MNIQNVAKSPNEKPGMNFRSVTGLIIRICFISGNHRKNIAAGLSTDQEISIFLVFSLCASGSF